ncbi:MAG: 6-carboxytetrahydropterin synthase (EC @ Queuosine biosynthesis QueD, PTPS-I [uncultured Campylobacterales bacterium]|uniref:6-carboxy-5,6,7,8-tetrahydropterin synthase n=1 Tax=uncultured Campylobacterales bacterium TaxID=352960 RepID=A0A6S6TBM3_9BACT|nr:MAG: 6-carboxytetrahydropterin synthase (EC @ Queuosine biosynthesis QueD, PTPS-I [uncultured Campylobacterales bacterium]
MASSFNISKSFDFCYGHRVWTQELNKDFSLDSCSVCRHLHGHQGKVIVHLSSKSLVNGMVTDFAHLNWFKKFLDDNLDHRFIIDINDPLFGTLLPHFKDKKNLLDVDGIYKIPDFTSLDIESHEKELYESYVIVDFVPTSESLSNWLLEIVQAKMSQIDIDVSKIEFHETPKSKCEVYP